MPSKDTVAAEAVWSRLVFQGGLAMLMLIPVTLPVPVLRVLVHERFGVSEFETSLFMSINMVGAALAAFKMLSATTELRDRLEDNTRYFREKMTAAGFAIRPGVHPIVPIMLGDAGLSVRMADALLDKGIYVIGFSYPVVPKGQARIRVQISAGHTRAHLDKAIAEFTQVGKALEVIA